MRLLRILFLVMVVAGCKAVPSTPQSFTDRQKSDLADFKSRNKIGGLAFALFTNDTIIWEQCLGQSTYGFPVNDSTLFNIQSVSKNFTALAVMIAVQEHLVDLDTPIAAYLPDFRINSCFEENPQARITLRMLLSHTAGLTHEAPQGNNYDYTNCPFDKHIRSIDETWLKFPAGEGYSYSNLGMDLAASIVEKSSGMPFNTFLRKKIFEPLNMKSSTIDDGKVVSNTNRTEGTIKGVRSTHVQIPLMGSGAVYTNLSEMTGYTRMLMNGGSYRGREIISHAYLDTMFTIRSENYALGTYIDRDNDTWYINHNGGGYGYSATMIFFPEYNLGAVMLCNKTVNCFHFSMTMMDKYIKESGLPKDTSVTRKMNNLNGRYLSDPALFNEFKQSTCPGDTLFKEEWSRYTGKYAMRLKNYDFRWYVRVLLSLGFFRENVYIFKSDQALVMQHNGAHSILSEYEPGLFFTSGGEVLDFRGRTPVFKNVEMKKVSNH
jgi:CubicO group peptidase (beta-lactamase class C family)